MAQIKTASTPALRFRLLTVVWGTEFVDRFIRLALRTLLAPDNLPAVSAHHPIAWSLYTTAADAARLRESPLFSLIPEAVDFEIHIFSLKEIDPANPSSHWILWQRGIVEAKRRDECLITVAADHVFAEDTLSRWVTLFEEGKLAVFSPGIQVVLETLEEEFTQRHPNDRPLTLAPGQITDLMFRHLHPVNITMFRDSPRWMMHPEYLLRALPGAGFTQNILTSHAVAFRPARITINESFSPTDHLDQIAFEPSRFISAEPLLKNSSFYYRRWKMDDVTLSHFGFWGDKYFAPSNICESTFTHVYEMQDALPKDDAHRAALSSRLYMAQMRTSRVIYRLWQKLRTEGLYKAALLFAAGHILARLRRRIVLRGPTALFVPDDATFSRIEPAEYTRLLKDKGDDLISALKGHVSLGCDALHKGDRLSVSDDGPIRTLAGTAFRLDARGSIRIVREPITFESFVVYVVNQPLSPLALKPENLVSSLRRIDLSMRHHPQRLSDGLRFIVLTVARRSHRLHGWIFKLRGLIRNRHQTISAPAIISPAADRAHKLLHAAFRTRSITILRELYDFYAGSVLDGSFVQSSPATLLASIPPAEPVQKTLETTLALQPSLSEAWLELGYVRLDANDTNGALEAFTKAARLVPTYNRSPCDPDPRVRAAIMLAVILERAGKPGEALAALESAPHAPPVPWRAHYLAARLQLAMGRPKDALESLEQCMRADNVAPTEAKLLPSSLAALTAVS